MVGEKRFFFFRAVLKTTDFAARLPASGWNGLKGVVSHRRGRAILERGAAGPVLLTESRSAAVRDKGGH